MQSTLWQTSCLSEVLEEVMTLRIERIGDLAALDWEGSMVGSEAPLELGETITALPNMSRHHPRPFPR